MLHKHRGWWAVAILVGVVLPALFAAGSHASTVPATPDAKKLDLFKLPPEAVLIICDAAKDAATLAPHSVRMTPEKYQELLDQIARLKAKVDQADKLRTPSACQLKGQIEGNFLLLEAQFEFATNAPNTVVWLACAPALADWGPIGRPHAAVQGGGERLFRAGRETGQRSQADPRPHSETDREGRRSGLRVGIATGRDHEAGTDFARQGQGCPRRRQTGRG